MSELERWYIRTYKGVWNDKILMNCRIMRAWAKHLEGNGVERSQKERLDEIFRHRNESASKPTASKWLVKVTIRGIPMTAYTAVEADTEEQALVESEKKTPIVIDWEYDGIGLEIGSPEDSDER